MPSWTKPIVVLAVLGLLALGGIVVFWAATPAQPDTGPVPVAYDKQTCAHCHMHVSEPGFAAQLRLDDGQVLFFDDPGCLFAYVKKHAPEARSMYFRHVQEDRWLSAEQVGFVRRSPTPMGYGFAAVERSHEGALSLEKAREAMLRDEPKAHGGMP